MEENQDIKEAKEELERMDYEQRLYEAKRDGEAIGKVREIKKNQEETALKMLQEKIDIKVIAKVTGLTKEEIKNLENKK